MRFAALAALAAAIFVAVIQLGGQSRAQGAPPFLTEALGAYEADAPLVRHPAPGVVLAIEDSGFRIQSRNATATVTLETQGAKPGDWHRFANGVSRPTAVGVETILVEGPTLEQFLTVHERQGLRTWRWRIDSTHPPRLGDDGGVAFLDAGLHKLTDLSIAPVRILGADGKDITPKGLRWGLEQRNGVWWLTLRLDDAKLPLPYVIDPAVTHRNTQTGTASSATSVSVTKPTGVQASDLLVAHVMVTGNVTGGSGITASGWTAIASGSAANAATQASFYRIAGSSEPASYSFAWANSQSAVATVSAYYGVKSSSVFDVNGAVASTNNTTNVTAQGITTTVSNDLVLAFFGSVSNSTYTPPSGFTERGDVGITGISGSTADETKTTAGATGNATATSTVSARAYGHQAAFKVDNVAPSVTMSDPGSPVSGTITLQTSAASDTDSYVAQVQFQRSPAGQGSWTNVGPADTTAPYSVSFDTTTVGDGLYDFRAVATDGAGNTGNSATISNREIDNNAPSSTTNFPASGGAYNTTGWNAGCGTNGFCGTYSDASGGSGVQKVEISIRRNSGNFWNGSSFGSASEVWNAASLAAGSWSYTFPASNFPADDTYTIRVRATDNVSIAETPSSRSFTYDTVAPDTSITSNPSNPSNSTGASFSFTSTVGGSTFECELDGGGYSPCTSAKSYPSLSQGSHTFFVRATDGAGNTDSSAASYTWTVDSVAPNTTVDSAPANPSASADATFSFSASEGGSTFECELDGGGFSSCSGTRSYSSLSDGSHTFEVRATDAATNTDDSPAEFTWTVDTGAPSSTARFPADGAFYRTSSWNAGCTTSGFCGTDSDAASGVQAVELSIERVGTGLYWNGSTFSSGSELFFTTSLSAGEWWYGFGAANFQDDDYTVRVKATDNAGNAEPASSRTFTFDATAPTGSLTAPAGGAVVTGASVTLSSDSADNGTGVALVTFERRPAGEGTWTPIDTDSSAPYSVSWDTTDVADGDYDLRVTTEDESGNSFTSATRTVTVDNTGPTSLLSVDEGTRPDLQYFDPATDTYYYNPAATGDFTLHDAATDPAGVASVDFSTVADTGFTGSATSDTTAPFDSDTYSFTTASASAPATQTVVATDALGNATNDTFDLVRDVAAPAGGSVSYADGYDADGTVVVTTADGNDGEAGVDESTGVLERRTSTLTDGTCASFSDGWTTVTSTDTVASGLCAQYRYRVSDRVSNEATYTSVNVVKVDQAAPNTSIGSTPSDPTNETDATFTFSSTETGSTFQCKLDGGGFSSCSTPMSYSSLADGSHTFDVRATDQAGNAEAAPQSYSWTVDTAAPDTLITASPSDPSNSSSADFSFTSTEGGSTFACEIDAGGFSACTSPASFTGLAAGSHSFEVRATDTAGNPDGSAASFVWTIAAPDLTAPTTPSSFKGKNAAGRLVLSWKPATDDSGLVEAYLVYANGTIAKTVSGSTLSADMGAFSQRDTRTFQVAARDAAGNASAKSVALVVVPKVAKLSLVKARAALKKHGLKSGKITYVRSSLPKGSVISAGKTGLVRRGSAIPLKVSKG